MSTIHFLDSIALEHAANFASHVLENLSTSTEDLQFIRTVPTLLRQFDEILVIQNGFVLSLYGPSCIPGARQSDIIDVQVDFDGFSLNFSGGGIYLGDTYTSCAFQTDLQSHRDSFSDLDLWDCVARRVMSQQAKGSFRVYDLQ